MGNWNNWDSMMNWGGQPWMGVGFGLLAIWSLVWSALALWRAAKEDNKYWFVAFLLIHTAGILEIVYLFFFAKNKLTLSSIQKQFRSKK